MPAPKLLAAASSRGAKRSADAVMTLSDYDFALSAPLTAGTRTIRIGNTAEQSHEMLLVRLAPGATVAQFIAAVEKPQGPPPGEAVGGITGIARGEENTITVNLTKGDYGLICFWPDAKDRKPHFAHGMAKQIRIGRAAAQSSAARRGPTAPSPAGRTRLLRSSVGPTPPAAG